MGFLDSLFLRKKARKHELKWPLPEARLIVPIDDCNEMVAKLEKLKAKFLRGGVYKDFVHAKKYGEGVYAYFLVRTDARSEKEFLVSDAYMLQEDDKLGLNLSVGSYVVEDLEKLGFKRVFERRVEEWHFAYAAVRVDVFDVEGFGKFLQVCLPSTKLVQVREVNEKTAFAFLKKLGFERKDVVPTDVLTLQLLSLQGEAQGAAQGGAQASAPAGKGFGGDFKLG